MKKLIFIFFTSLLFGFLQISQTNAATRTVTSNANSGAGTLRQVLIDATNGDTIEFNLSAGNEAITVSSAISVPWGKSLIIDGDNTAGSGTNVTVQVSSPGSSTYEAMTIDVGSGYTATLKNLTLRGGNKSSSSGGTLYMYSSGASLVLENCTIKDGRARFGAGVWANSFNTLTITNSTIRDNTSTEHGAGMRVDSFTGTVNITSSTFTNNVATLTGGNYYGGGIYFQNNSAQGTVNIDKTTFSNNSVYMAGGGVYASNIANMTITNSTFANNTVTFSSGGGLSAYGGNLIMSNTTFFGNTTTYSGAGAYIGGTGKTFTLTNITVANNTASGSDSDGLYVENGTLYLKNSILANNSTGSSKDFGKATATIVDNGYNIVETSQNYTWAGTGDITGDQANLNLSGSLANNSTVYGTQTLALSTGSVAINAGNGTANNGVNITSVDQRGLYRAGVADIGAYEYNATVSPATFTLTYSAGPHGSITGTSPQTVNQGENGSQVTAVPIAGYAFSSWSDAVATAARTDTNVQGDITVSASFTEATYTLSYDAQGGSVSPSSKTVSYNSAVGTLPTPTKTGYTFTSWNTQSDGLGNTYTSDTVYTLTSNSTIYAQWTINSYNLNYTAGAHGTLTGSSSQMVEYNSDGTEITAVPDANYHFVRWNDDITDNPRTDTNVTGNISVTAEFAIDQFTLSYIAGENGSLTGSSSQIVDYGSNGSEVSAVPDEGYAFLDWSDAVLTASRTDTNITANKTVTANFEIDTDEDNQPNTDDPDDDNDGIPDTNEDSAPNSGDVNNDSIPDRLQPNILSFESIVNDEYNTLELNGSCEEIDAIDSLTPELIGVADSGYEYPTGLVDFDINCTTPGDSTTITLYFFGEYNFANLVVRKFNGTNYTILTGAVLGEATIGGETAVTVTYTLTDGGANDTDGVANGVISDPVGISQTVTNSDNDGSGSQSLSCKKTFRDINTNSEYYGYVCELANREIIKGYSDGLFHPNNTLTRGQVSSLIVKTYSLKSGNTLPNNFSDPISGPHEKDILILKELGIINGYSDNTFRSNTEINKSQLAKILYKTLKHKGIEIDVDTITVYSDLEAYSEFEEYITIMSYHKIMTGNGTSTFAPDIPVKRDQMAKILYNTLELI